MGAGFEGVRGIRGIRGFGFGFGFGFGNPRQPMSKVDVKGQGSNWKNGFFIFGWRGEEEKRRRRGEEEKREGRSRAGTGAGEKTHLNAFCRRYTISPNVRWNFVFSRWNIEISFFQGVRWNIAF